MDRLLIAGFALVIMAGCRYQGGESFYSANKPDNEPPMKGDPYAWGGIQEATGGLVAASQQTMESTSYVEPKFMQLAGTAGFVSMAGWAVNVAKLNDTKGDYQPLPNREHAEEEHPEGESEGH
jgi:hypothetical protein